jgi:hypothetical protein
MEEDSSEETGERFSFETTSLQTTPEDGEDDQVTYLFPPKVYTCHVCRSTSDTFMLRCSACEEALQREKRKKRRRVFIHRDRMAIKPLPKRKKEEEEDFIRRKSEIEQFVFKKPLKGKALLKTTDSKCKLCKVNDKDGAFVHGRISHTIYCWPCTKLYEMAYDRCPVCARVVQKVTRNMIV